MKKNENKTLLTCAAVMILLLTGCGDGSNSPVLTPILPSAERSEQKQVPLRAR